MTTASRVIKNTSFLYVKMIITVFVSLYTTRLILNSLGASDFGIFNVVGGAIGMLGFLNSTLANATQRFMSYAEGEGNLDNKRKVFNVSLILHFIIALFTLLLLIAFMYPLFHGILTIETDRIFAAQIVYCSLIFSTILTIINVPYDSVMNAHENMKYYAFVGIFESILRLIVALICVYTSSDKLIVYGVLMAIIPLITLSIMKIYCHKYYEECIILPKHYWDVVLVKKIAFFSGWNFLTAISSLLSFQGVGLVLNHFFGTILNAAYSIAHQLNGQLSSFAGNMLRALNPVIVKNAGSGNLVGMNQVTISGCKFSTYLILIFAIPAIIEMPYILKLWLMNIPEWTILFCVLQIIQTILIQMANSASIAIYGKGDIKGYAIYKSITNILPVILTYISFMVGGGPYWLFVIMIMVWAIGGDIVIITYAKKKCNLNVMDYLNNVVFPILGMIIMMFIFGGWTILCMSENFIRLLFTCFFTTIGMTISLSLFGLTNMEKQFVINLFYKLKNRIK